MPQKEINFTQQEQVIDMEIDELLIEGVTSIRKLHIVLNTFLLYLYTVRKMGAID